MLKLLFPLFRLLILYGCLLSVSHFSNALTNSDSKFVNFDENRLSINLEDNSNGSSLLNNARPISSHDKLHLLAFGKGIYKLSFDLKTMQFSTPVSISTNRPIYGAVSRSSIIYTTDGDYLKALKWNGESLELINKRKTDGELTYVALSPDEKHIAVASYGSGTLNIFSINSDTGAINNDAQKVERKNKARAHWVQWGPKGKNVYVVYLGHDVVVQYAFNSQTGKLGPAVTAWTGETRDGPRHMAFHPKNPNLAYIFTEYSSQVVVCRINNDGSLQEFQRVSSLPDGYSGKNTGAHIQISADGRTLYASNRGHNSVAVFAINNKNGMLRSIEIEPESINRPRFFVLLEQLNLLLVGNQNSNTISAMKVNHAGDIDAITETAANISGVWFIMKVPEINKK